MPLVSDRTYDTEYSVQFGFKVDHDVMHTLH